MGLNKYIVDQILGGAPVAPPSKSATADNRFPRTFW